MSGTVTLRRLITGWLKNALYVDSAMMGPLPVNRHKVPMLACGKGAAAWKGTMQPYGMVIDLVTGNAGRATQIKL